MQKRKRHIAKNQFRCKQNNAKIPIFFLLLMRFFSKRGLKKAVIYVMIETKKQCAHAQVKGDGQ